MTVYYPTFKPAVSSLTMITRDRTLPFAGEVLVRVGNRVEPDEIVARTLVPEQGQRFPVARILGVSDEDLARHLVLEDGDEVEAGDVVVRVGRWRQRFWRCPVDGTLSTAEVDQGYVIVIPPAQTLALRARLKGFVTAVEPYRAITIQTPAALVQGAFGFGGEQHGVLRMAVTDEGDELLPELLDERAAFTILVGGGPIGIEALNRAMELQVRGVIVGSITEQTLRDFLGYSDDAAWQVGGAGWDFPPGTTQRDFPLTVMVTEGVGRQPMSARAFELLATYDGDEALLDGRTWLHGARMSRPQVIIPVPRADPDEIPEDEGAEALAIGAQVRLLSSADLGQVGKVVDFPRRKRSLVCDTHYYVAEVLLADGHVVEVPFENLEVLGPIRSKTTSAEGV